MLVSGGMGKSSASGDLHSLTGEDVGDVLLQSGANPSARAIRFLRTSSQCNRPGLMRRLGPVLAGACSRAEVNRPSEPYLCIFKYLAGRTVLLSVNGA